MRKFVRIFWIIIAIIGVIDLIYTSIEGGDPEKIHNLQVVLSFAVLTIIGCSSTNN